MFGKIRQIFSGGENQPTNSLVGKVLRQRYQITEELGSGGMGETYVAIDLDIPTSPKPKCVVKRIKPQQKHNPHIIRLFREEGAALYKLSQNYDRINSFDW
ncbi:hypothetical protein [Oscillatoria salina]|uniref:hypothetical protein n=1 Tax=Oscillatoria salina TaxID=331517 RepID=UPI001CCC6367|nr:hypothetical protein [Oscillatoria salina]MBZ8179210.1 hypothetical protein [Oscillatoria salina IIICB1]